MLSESPFLDTVFPNCSVRHLPTIAVPTTPSLSQDLQDLEDSVSELKPEVFPDGFENSMFTGEYLMPSDMIEGDPADGGAGCGVGIGPRAVDVV